jgi:hypothetical protein
LSRGCTPKHDGGVQLDGGPPVSRITYNAAGDLEQGAPIDAASPVGDSALIEFGWPHPSVGKQALAVAEVTREALVEHELLAVRRICAVKEFWDIATHHLRPPGADSGSGTTAPPVSAA